MARASGTSVENNFVKGFLTEYSGFNFPENACEETLNCVFDQTGKVTRRLGLALETTVSPPVVTFNDDSVSTSFVWKSAGFRSENSFVVQQIDNIIHFYKVISDNIADNKASFTFDLNTHSTGGSPGSYPSQFSNGSGRLFVSNPDTETFYLKYDSDTDSITSTVIEVKIRDFKVLEDGYDINESMSTSESTPAYLYNLYNQGWTEALLNGWKYHSNTSYPTKGQVWWYFRDISVSTPVTPFVNFYPVYRYKFQDLGFSLAPRGYYLLNAFNQDRDLASGLSGLPSLTSRNKRPSCNAFINGRIFLSGVEADGYNGVVYFSNILKDADADIRFYQNGDPSSEVNYQLLANDGGAFTIPEAGKVIRMVPVKNTLVIFCTNGVWTVQGNEGVGFTATDFAVERISDEPCLNNQSYITVSTFPVWWTNEGIFTLQSSNVGAINSQNLTKTTIQTFFDTIPTSCKRYVKSAYNTLTKEIFWIYSDDFSNPKTFNRVLVLNVPTQAFYVHSLSTSIKIIDLVAPPVSGQTEEEAVVTNSLGLTVQDSSFNDVTAVELVDYNPDSLLNVKFIVGYDSDKIGFAKFSNVNKLDWEDLASPGEEYDSYFETGPRVRGEGQRKFTENYVTVFSKYESNSSCWMFPIWDYGLTNDSNRFGTPQQAITSDSRFNYSSKRLRLRGSGKAVKFRFESEGTKPFNILGWSTFETIQERV